MKVTKVERSNKLRIWVQSAGLGKGPYKELVEQHAKRVADPGTEVEVHGTSKDEFADTALVRALVVKDMIGGIIKAESEGFDAAVISCAFDLGLYEAREVVDIPVFGVLETPAHFACMIGRKFSIVELNDEHVEHMEDNIRRYGLIDKYIRPRFTLGYHFEDPDIVNSWENPEPFLRRFMEVANKLISDGADVLISGSGFIAAQCFNNEIFELSNGKVPVLDAFGILIKTAEIAAKLRKVSSFFTSRKAYVKPPVDLMSRVRRLL